MKIDLHIHTLKTKKGDGISRDVDSDYFKNQLKESNVGLAAVTNHNVFDDKQFHKLTNKSIYTLFPGIEVDFLENNNKRSQMNIIFSNEDVGINLAKKLSNFLQINNINSNNPIHIDELWSKIKNMNIIIYADYKGDKTTLSNNCFNYLKKLCQNEIPIIHDVNKVRTYRILMANKINSLIGSDIQSWENDNYLRESEDLIESQWKIENFNSLKTLLLTGNPIGTWLSKLRSKNFKLNIDTDILNIDILTSGLNVIIGDKATGKSEILKSLKENLKYDDYSYFSEDEKTNDFKNITKDDEDIFIENKEIEEKIIDKIKYIKNLKTESNNIALDFYNNILIFASKNWKIQNSELDNIQKVNFSILKDVIKKIHNLWNFLIGYKNDLFIDNEIEKEYKKIIFYIKENLIEKFIFNQKENISKNISDKLGIRKILSEEKQLFSSNLSVGLINLFNFKNDIQDSISYIKRIKLNRKEKEIFKENIPTIGELYLVDKNFLFPFNMKYKDIKKDNVGKHKFTKIDFKDSLNIFNKFNFDNYDKFKNYWNDENIEKGVIFTKKLILDKNKKKKKLSGGQESIFLLAKALNSEANYFLLDEPSSRIGSNTIMEYVNEKLIKLRRSGKTIIYATHNASLGMNALPNKYIYRKKSGENNYETFFSYIYQDYFIDNENKTRKDLPFNKIVINLLEGGKVSYETRKDIYDSKIRN